MLSIVAITLLVVSTSSFSSPATKSITNNQSNYEQKTKSKTKEVGNVLILDHLNINHEKGRHDLLKSFYFDFLNCGVDPRKAENLSKGRKTLWANIGCQQFHLPEGTPEAQILDGQITLAFSSLEPFKERYDSFKNGILKESLFHLEEVSFSGDNKIEYLQVTDPWGNDFRLVSDPELQYKDSRGSQPGEQDENGVAMIDLTLHVAPTSNFEGIGRFYEKVLGAPVLSCTENSCVIKVGPNQSLSFVGKSHADGRVIQHESMVSTDEDDEYESNYGPHVSMYVKDLRTAYRKAKEIGALYVNPRFKRRAFTEEEAADQCMFRCLDIIDPENVSDGAILRLEHEVRAVLTKTGDKYKSCPFIAVPEGCVA